jgi:hypothetical protein
VTEDYVRPPIVALEPASRRVRVWRFRALLLGLLAILAVIIFLVARAIIDSGEGNAQAAPPPRSNVTSPSVIRG